MNENPEPPSITTRGATGYPQGNVYVDRHGIAHTGVEAWRAQKADRRAREAADEHTPTGGAIGRVWPPYVPGDTTPAKTIGTRP